MSVDLNFKIFACCFYGLLDDLKKKKKSIMFTLFKSISPERILQIEIQPLPTNGKSLSGHKQVRNQISILMACLKSTHLYMPLPNKKQRFRIFLSQTVN